MFRAAKPLLWEIVEIVLIALAIILPIRYFLAQPFSVRGQSMEPNFFDGDYLIIDQISYRFREPKRGEVLVFRANENGATYYIKRLIGLPGETVIIENGDVEILNQSSGQQFLLNEHYLAANVSTGGDLRVTLGLGEYFVLGDNRASSYDSRRWGALERNQIVGRAWLRPWPISPQFVIESPMYSKYQTQNVRY